MSDTVNSEQQGWQRFYEATRNRQVRPLLLQALEYVSGSGDALDLGCGVPRDSVELLERGFRVTAVDASPEVAELAQEIDHPRFRCVISNFTDFSFEQYDLISAQISLPFNPPDTFDEMIGKVFGALKPDGIFTGQLFGVKDSWNVPERNMTFHTAEQVHALLRKYGLEIIKFEEAENDRPAVSGPKHWHYFDIIARKGSSA